MDQLHQVQQAQIAIINSINSCQLPIDLTQAPPNLVGLVKRLTINQTAEPALLLFCCKYYTILHSVPSTEIMRLKMNLN